MRRRGERMSATLIASLWACAETPGMPPYITDSHELADVGESLVPPQEAPTPAPDEAAISTEIESRDPDLWLYRERTVAILRRYMRLSIEVGRMPSLLGREFFRTRVTAYKSSTFEDSAIFVHDVERSLEELSEFEKKLIAKVVLQRYSKEEAGRLLGCGY